jgi:hypothetical protein
MLIYHILKVITPRTPICDMKIIKLFTWLTNLFQSYKITMFNRYYTFHKTKNHFKIIFWIYLDFFWYIVMYIFCHKYVLKLYNISWKKNLWWNFLCYNLAYYVKNLKKYAPILQWIKFKHGHLRKKVQCDNIFGFP